jgi:Amt family ammonium transporter
MARFRKKADVNTSTEVNGQPNEPAARGLISPDQLARNPVTARDLGVVRPPGLSRNRLGSPGVAAQVDTAHGAEDGLMEGRSAPNPAPHRTTDDMSQYLNPSLLDRLGAGDRTARRVAGDARWGRSLRRFARVGVWAIPVAAALFGIASIWGWPRPAETPSGQSPGTWLVVTLFSLVLGLIGVLALTALLATTPGRGWAIFGLLATATGTVVFAPMLGLVGVARAAVTSMGPQMGVELSADLEGRFFDGSVGRWLVVGGLSLLAVGWFALACAVAASGVLNKADGYLVLIGIGVAVLGAYLAWEFLLVIAAMALLAAGLGLAWTAGRLTPDGRLPDDE